MNRRTDILIASAVVLATGVALGGIAMAGAWEPFWEWAWARHHNLWSWYIRAVFLLPFAWYCYRRSFTGIAATLVALVSSMFWFPAPAVPDPAAVSMLDQELVFILGAWTGEKIAESLLVPAVFAAIGIALWRRSIVWGAVVINAAVLFKVVWAFIYTPGEGAVVHMTAALSGLLVVDAGLVLAVILMRRRRRRAPDSPAGHGTAALI